MKKLIEFTHDLADVPKLSGPIMFPKGGLIIPDYERLHRTYNAAGWRWCRLVGEMPNTDETFEGYQMSGCCPSAARIQREIQEAAAKVGELPGNYVQFGGLVIFRSLSSKIGVMLEWSLTEHWIRLKQESTAPQSEMIVEEK